MLMYFVSCLYVYFMVATCIINIKHFIVQLMHTNYKIFRLLKIVKIIKAAPTGSHKTIHCLAKITHLVPMYQYWCCQCYGSICRHNTDNINNDTQIGTRNVILAKHWMWLPDDGFMWIKTCWSSLIMLSILVI
jgi:hypothetical protein